MSGDRSSTTIMVDPVENGGTKQWVAVAEASSPSADELVPSNSLYYTKLSAHQLGSPPGLQVDDRGRPAALLPVKRGAVQRIQEVTSRTVREHARLIGRAVLLALLVGYTVYFAFAIRYSVQAATALIVITSLVVAWLLYAFIRDTFGARIYRCCLGPCLRTLGRTWPCTRWIVIPAILIGIVLAMSLWLVEEVRQLQSLAGIFCFILYLFITCKHPSKVRWRPVIWGFALQFAMALFVLRFKPGFDAIKWLSDQITTFINYSLEGASTVFGDPFLLLHPFAFVAMPMLIYIGAVMSILYYMGITQMVAEKIGWFVEVTMGTTAIESLSVGANIFLNGMDTMLMLRQYLPALTASEFHCFLVGNHSTVAGFAFALFVMFGAPPQHLLSAAVMSAPAAIAVAKLNFPETEESKTKCTEDVSLDKGDETNVFEAGANGAAVAGKTVAAVIVNFIGFLSLLGFINATLSWLGGRVGYPALSFQVICSYLFFPLALLMGIDIGECKEVAKLLGMKVFVSELFAYQELGTAIDNGLSARSASITTYALCGFSSLSTLAIAVGVWNVVCPSKTKEMTAQLPRVITNANISCFLTACIAGIMYNPSVSSQGRSNEGAWIMQLLGLIPSYKDIMNILPSF